MSDTIAEPELHKTGEPAYRIVQHTDAFDIRAYEPYLVAEVTLPGPADDASRAGGDVPQARSG